MDKLLLEKLSLAGIAWLLDVSETWLQGYVNQKYACVEQRVGRLVRKTLSFPKS